MRRGILQSALALGAYALAATAGAPAQATEACFKTVNGNLVDHYQFELTYAQLKALGTRSVAGRQFFIGGGVSLCPILSEWPLVGTVISTPKSIAIGFRELLLDGATCGA